MWSIIEAPSQEEREGEKGTHIGRVHLVEHKQKGELKINKSRVSGTLRVFFFISSTPLSNHLQTSHHKINLTGELEFRTGEQRDLTDCAI